MPHSLSHDRRFYSGMAALLAIVIAAGFAPTFFARGAFFELPPLTSAVQLHGILGTAWVALYAVQTWLVAAERRAWHRRVGPIGAVAAVAFVASGVPVIGALEQSHVGESGATLAAHVFTNGAPLAAFAVLVAAGVGQRRVAARHKRFMQLAAVVLVPPAIGRLFGYLGVAYLNLPVYACFAFANVAYDVWSRRRPHAVSLFGATALVAIDLTTTWWLAMVGS
jgi:hypothetical protein